MPLIISAAPFMERMERRAALGKRRKNATERESPKDLEKTTDVRRLPEKGKKSSGGRRKPSGISCFWIWRKKRGTGENERELQEHIAFARKEVSSALLRKQSMERAAGGHMELDANPAVLSEAATELAGNYVFFKIPSARVNPRPGK